MGLTEETAGLFAVLGTFAEAGCLTSADRRGCRERVARLTGTVDATLTDAGIAKTGAAAVLAARAAAAEAPVQQTGAVPAEASHPPQKRARVAGLNSGFS